MANIDIVESVVVFLPQKRKARKHSDKQSTKFDWPIFSACTAKYVEIVLGILIIHLYYF